MSQNWREMPLVSHQAIINLIVATATERLARESGARHTPLQDRLQVADEVFARPRIAPHKFHSEWNCTITPGH